MSSLPYPTLPESETPLYIYIYIYIYNYIYIYIYTNRVGLIFDVCSVALAARAALAVVADGDGMEQNLGKAGKSPSSENHSKIWEVLATQLMNIKLAQLEAPQS